MSATAEHIIKYGSGPIGYMMLARETAYYQCLGRNNEKACTVKHRTLSGACKCKNGPRLAVRTKAGDLIRVRLHFISASNGESGTLVYPDSKLEEE